MNKQLLEGLKKYDTHNIEGYTPQDFQEAIGFYEEIAEENQWCSVTVFLCEQIVRKLKKMQREKNYEGASV